MLRSENQRAPGKGEAGRAQESVGLPCIPRQTQRSSFRAELKTQLGRGEGEPWPAPLRGAGLEEERPASRRGPRGLQDSNMGLIRLLRWGGGH